MTNRSIPVWCLVLDGRRNSKTPLIRKVHLFDMRLACPGRVTYQESRWLSAGERNVSAVDTPGGLLGPGDLLRSAVSRIVSLAHR